MRAKSLLLSGVVAGAAVVVPILPANTAWAAPAVTAAYSCAISGIGTESASVMVTGHASANTSTVNLSNTVFTITNSFGVKATVDNIKVHVGDPNKTSAPYKSSSAKVASSPAGWTAGHDSHGAFALHAGRVTIQNGATVSSAALSAKYTNKGPKGTVIKFKPALVTFDVTSPISTSATCTPKAPVPAFAHATE